MLPYLALPLLFSAIGSVRGANKYVFAHFMVGFTIDYTADDWKTQMSLAAQHDIDAFALNVGADPWQPAQVQTAYDTAGNVTLSSGSTFKVFLSLDMSSISNVTQVTDFVTRFTPLSANFEYNSRPLVSTFSGENNTLGGTSLSDGWQAAVKTPLANLSPSVNAYFVPSWSGLNAATAASESVVDGIMNWLAWPTTDANSSTTLDSTYLSGASSSSKTYMATVSPVFFTHYVDKNYIWRSDDNLMLNRWTELLQLSTQPDFIQIVSWNDFSESHYIGPQDGTPPSGTTWIDGIDHQAWLNMSDHYIQWYKSGQEPKISSDNVYFNYRTHSANATASSDSLGEPSNFEWASDNIYTATFLSSNTDAKQLTVTTGGSTTTYSVSSGINTFSTPFGEGAVSVALLDKNGHTIGNASGAKSVSNSISTYNFNPVSQQLTAKSAGESLKSASRLFILGLGFVIGSALW
jgi:glucan endo-1,3-alpha-glucosidase